MKIDSDINGNKINAIELLCMDETRHSISRFDELKKDPGYTAVLDVRENREI